MSRGISGPPQAAASLELTTKLGEVERAGWRFRLYPEAAEGGGAFLSAARRAGPGGGPGQPRAAIEAGRRARGQLRRYCAANRLNRLGTLTYAGAGCHDPHELRRDLADFFRILRRGYARSFAYLWVPEWHAQGHGLHAHFAVGRFLPRHRIEQAWGRGFVHIKQLGDLASHSGPLEEARQAARYLAKYVAKDLGADTSVPERRRVEGLHRYEVAQGFQPRSLVLRGRSRNEVLGLACDRMGAEPSYVWLSDDAAEWHGPPALWASWDA